MKTDENFYDIIGSKFADRQVPFDEGNWQSMRKMIDDSRSDKRRTMWLVAAACLLLFAGATFGIYEWRNTMDTPQYSAGITNTLNSNASIALSGQNKQITGQNNSVTENNHQIANNQNNSINNNTNSSNRTPFQTNAVTTEMAKQNGEEGYQAKLYGKKHTVKNDNVSGAAVEIAANVNVRNANLPENISQNNLHINNDDNPGKASMPSNSIAVKSTTSSTKINSHKTDSLAAADNVPQRFSDEPRVFQGKTNIFSVEAGAEYSFGWAVSSDGSLTQGKGLNYNAGLGYEHYMGSKIFLKTGIQFSIFGNMHTATYNYQHNVGNIIYDSVITTRRLYFLRIPLQAEYFIGRNKKSSIGGGGSVWFLIGNSGYATTYQQGENTPPMNVMQYSKNASLSGYTNIDFSAHIFYRYVINNKFSMYFIFYSEFTSMREKSFFGENITDNTRGCQYTLSYNLN